MPKRWTPEEEALLFKESANMSPEQLAKKYGVTPKSVAVKLQKIRLALRKTGTQDVLALPRQRTSVGGEAKKWTQQEEIELLALHMKGWKTDRIAEHFKVSVKAVSVKLLKVKKKSKENGGLTVEPTRVPEPVALPEKAPPVSVVQPVTRSYTPPTPQPPKPLLAPPMRPAIHTSTPVSGKHKAPEGDTNTQFKVWNGTEWVSVKIPKKMIHL